MFISIKNFIRTYPSWSIFFGGLFIFTIGSTLLTLGFGIEEARFVVFAQEMLRNGLSPFPTLLGQPYPDYPATYTVFIYLISLLTHQVTPFSAIFPSAFASALMLAFTYKIGATRSHQWGLYAVLFELLTYQFLFLATIPSPDPLIAAITVISFYLVYTQQKTWLLPLLFIIGFAIRGPIGLIIPTLVSAVFYLTEKNFRKFILISICSGLLLTLGTTLLFFLAQHTGGDLFAKQVIGMELTNRIHHLDSRGFFYYFIRGMSGYALPFPIALVTLFFYRKQLKNYLDNPDVKLLVQLASWLLVILFALSIPQAKHLRYIVSITPAIALISAYGFMQAGYNRLLLIIGAIISVVLFIFIGQPVAERYFTSVKPTVDKIKQIRAPDQTIVYYQIDRDYHGLKFLALFNDATSPVFLTTSNQLAAFNKPALFIAPLNSYNALPANLKTQFKILWEQKLLPATWIVFTR